jgi:hypothetical protein
MEAMPEKRAMYLSVDGVVADSVSTGLLTGASAGGDEPG